MGMVFRVWLERLVYLRVQSVEILTCARVQADSEVRVVYVGRVGPKQERRLLGSAGDLGCALAKESLDATAGALESRYV